MNGVLTMEFLLAVLVIVIGSFIRICVGIRRGGGRLTTIVLGATDGFLTHEKSKAAETIVDENGGKKFEEWPSSDPQEKWRPPCGVSMNLSCLTRHSTTRGKFCPDGKTSARQMSMCLTRRTA